MITGPPYCRFTNSSRCFRLLTDEEKILRFDNVDWLHTCPYGKALDKAVNLCTGACLIVDQRNRPPEPPSSSPYGGYY